MCDAQKTVQVTKIWHSHLLITNLGIGYTGPTDNELNFSTWIKLHEGQTQIKKDGIYFDSISFIVIRDDGFESEKEFKIRAKNFGTFCKSLYNASEIEFLKEYIKDKSNYYVPIDFTELYQYIPERDKILYSTTCKATNKRFVGNRDITTKSTPHVLITRSGFAFISAKGESKGEVGFIFNSWYNVSPIKIKEPTRIRILNLPGVWKNSRTFFSTEMGIWEAPNETIESINERKGHFAKFCTTVQKVYREYYNEMMNYNKDIREKYTKDGNTEFLDKIVPFMLSGFYRKGLEVLEEVLKIIPEQEAGMIWYYKGVALSKLNRNDEALDSYNQALKIDPQNHEAKRKTYELKHKINLDSISIKEQEKSLKILRKALVKFSKKKFKDSLVLFEESLERNPFNVEVLKFLGLNHEALGRNEEAVKCFQKILKINPYNNEAAGDLSRLKSKEG